MLFKETHLQGIRLGKISLAFRKWQKPSVLAGSLIHTSIGMVKIDDVEVVSEKEITAQDALRAGFEGKHLLLKSLNQNITGTIFKISISFHSEDPRIKLRERTELTEEQFLEMKRNLQRLDKFSKKGNWTETILLTIKDNPQLHAIGISKLTGFEKGWLKLNIRKLKNLGLTISHTVGYEISPLGKVFLEKLDKEKQNGKNEY